MFQVESLFGPAIIVIFCLGYIFVFAEEFLQLRKSKPVMIAGGIIWVLVAIDYRLKGQQAEVSLRLGHVLLEYAELFLFLLSATSFVNSMVERNVFEALRARLIRLRLSYRGIFWITGTIAFFLSPFADNLTTALVMGTVVIAAMSSNKKAMVGSIINVVVAANAGGAFSPFGDITTLMIWQKGVLHFGQFFVLFVPALVSWLVPAAIISLTISGKTIHAEQIKADVKKGGYVVATIFLLTIITTVMLHRSLHLQAFLGMMLGLGVLNLYSYFLHRSESKMFGEVVPDSTESDRFPEIPRDKRPFSIFNILRMVEWDTFLFFYGIMLCVGGLGAIGYLHGLSKLLYVGLGNSTANISVGLLSAVIDNIPLTYAVLMMMPHMGEGQWLLLTLSAGIGGSLLSIGSAAGVALMGVNRSNYTFLSHLKWSWAILLGFAAGIGVHMYMNAALFR